MTFVENMDKLESQYRVQFDAWKADPNPDNTSVLLKTIQPEIDRGIKAHVGRSNPNLQSRARRMALQAAQSYDPTRAKLGTHIVNQLQGLKRVSRQQQQVLRVPERVSLDQNRIEAARLELMDQTGRDPSLAELADHTGLSTKRIQHINKFKHPVAEGRLNAQDNNSEDSSFLPAVQQQDQSDPWLEVVYADLDGTNQKILEWTLGLHGEPVLSNQDIATRLRVSPGAISQRKAMIQHLIDEGERLNPF